MEIYLVGGAVRNRLLGLQVDEHDYVVVGATTDAMKSLGFQSVGKDFPVFLHPETKEEYALARTERKVGEGHKGFECETESVTLVQDLMRRDLTINAIAQDAEGNLVDPWGGVYDLEQRYLRHISPAFAEDPLRVLRVARFAALLSPQGFRVHPDTVVLMQAIVERGELAELAPERVFIELEKALQTSAPPVFFRVLQEVGANDVFWPEIGADDMDALQVSTPAMRSPELRFAALVSKLGSAEVDHIAHRIRLPARYRKFAQLVRSLYATWPNESSLGNEEIIDLLYRADAIRQPARFSEANQLLSLLWSASRIDAQTIESRWSAYLDALTHVTSDSIEGVEPGPALGAAIRDARIQRVATIRAGKN
ncbi:MAG: multifunctional CCA tRNA nucleotidyl transferase/2'3'-cyclic phosphodiesterase/2'nucleotidase/phosphatase [Pseudomonadales bacterium]